MDKRWAGHIKTSRAEQQPEEQQQQHHAKEEEEEARRKARQDSKAFQAFVDGSKKKGGLSPAVKLEAGRTDTVGAGSLPPSAMSHSLRQPVSFLRRGRAANPRQSPRGPNAPRWAGICPANRLTGRSTAPSLPARHWAQRMHGGPQQAKAWKPGGDAEAQRTSRTGKGKGKGKGMWLGEASAGLAPCLAAMRARIGRATSPWHAAKDMARDQWHSIRPPSSPGLVSYFHHRVTHHGRSGEPLPHACVAHLY